MKFLFIPIIRGEVTVSMRIPIEFSASSIEEAEKKEESFRPQEGSVYISLSSAKKLIADEVKGIVSGIW